MCLDVEISLSKFFKQPKEKYAWKVLRYLPMRRYWATPYFHNQVDCNILCANRKNPQFDIDNINWPHILLSLEGGAIHCFRTKKLAQDHIKNHLDDHYCDVFKVIGKNYIIHNETEIAFHEIKFVENPNDYYIEDHRVAATS